MFCINEGFVKPSMAFIYLFLYIYLTHIWMLCSERLKLYSVISIRTLLLTEHTTKRARHVAQIHEHAA